MALNLFGFTIERQKKPDLTSQSIVTPVPDDGSITATSAGYYGTFVDIDASTRSESDLISRYRQIASYPDCDNAIEEIISEAIAAIDDENPVTINLDNTGLSQNLKKTISEEFEKVKKLLDFNDKAHDIFRRWYVDGRIYYQKLIDKQNTTNGIQELRYIDPRKIKKVREVKKKKDPSGIDLVEKIDEYFVYNEKGLSYSPGIPPSSDQQAGIRIATDTIAFCPSGLMDLQKSLVIGYLHKAIKPVNQLKMMTDSLVIYRISRAPERRIFYIDVGNLPKLKAEQYMRDIMARYRNKVVYDSATGEVKDDRKFMTMLEDFWLPRREGGRGTEITTLPGGQNLGEISDIEYFQTKVYQSLNIPISRFQQQSGFNFGRQAEITHEEIKFIKFINRLRKKFNHLFNDLLRTQLLLKNIVTDADFDELKENISYTYAQDQYFQEMKDAENMRNRIDLLTQMQPFIGRFYSDNYIKKNVLRLGDDEIEEIDQEIQENPPPEQQEQ